MEIIIANEARIRARDGRKKQREKLFMEINNKIIMYADKGYISIYDSPLFIDDDLKIKLESLGYLLTPYYPESTVSRYIVSWE